VISRFVDHLPYYRQEQINARAGVHTPRSTLSAWAGQTGAQLIPVFEAHKDFVLGSRVLHADETTVKLLDPGAGKTKTAYMWAYGRGVFDPYPGVVYDFCIGRGAQFPFKFLNGWVGTLVRDGYAGYEKMLSLDDRFDAGCMAHARRKFDELIKFNASPVAAQALQRIAWLYRIEADAKDLPCEQRLLMRQLRSQPLCDSLHTWLTLERRRVPDGSGIAGAIDYSLKRWAALTRFLLDGDVPIDNNHIENQMRPWGVGRNNANLPFMRRQRHVLTRRPCARGCGSVVATSHNHSDCRNCIRALGGRYRAGLISGGLSRAKVRSFIARSASTYMWVVDGLSWPSHSAMSHGSAPD